MVWFQWPGPLALLEAFPLQLSTIAHNCPQLPFLSTRFPMWLAPSTSLCRPVQDFSSLWPPLGSLAPGGRHPLVTVAPPQSTWPVIHASLSKSSQGSTGRLSRGVHVVTVVIVKLANGFLVHFLGQKRNPLAAFLGFWVSQFKHQM